MVIVYIAKKNYYWVEDLPKFGQMILGDSPPIFL